MYSQKPTDLSGFSVMTPQEKDISFQMRRQNMLEQEAANRAELEEQHQLELDAERIKNERLLAQLKADNDAKLQRMRQEADRNLQADRHQREALSNAMVEAERKKADIERMSLQRMQNYKETNAKAILAALRRENSMLLRENTDLRYSPRISPRHSPAMGPFEHTPPPGPGPSPMLNGREPPLFLSRESYGMPSPGANSRALAMSAIERPPSRFSSHHHRSVSASVATPRSPAMSEMALMPADYIERPSSRSGHMRTSSAGNVYPRSPMMRDTPSFTQDHTGHLMPGSLPRTRKMSAHAPPSPLHPPSRTSSPATGYFDLPRSTQPLGHSPGPNRARFHDSVPSPALSQRTTSSFASYDSSPKYSPPRNHLQMELAAPPTGPEYRRQRSSSYGQNNHPRDLPMLPAPPSRSAYEQFGPNHAKALAEALSIEQQGNRTRHRRNSSTHAYGHHSGAHTRYHTPVGSHTPAVY